MYRWFLSSLLFLPLAAFGQEDPLEQAIELARWGEQNYSAEALAAAAQMACGTPHRVISSETFSSLEEAMAAEEPGEETILPPLHDRWLEAAKKLAQENEEPHLLKHLKTQSCITKGNTLGPAYRHGVLRPGKSSIFSQSFNAGEEARIVVIGKGLKLHLWTNDGQLVGKVVGTSKIHALSYTPPEFGPHWISVENITQTGNSYYLSTN